MMIGITERVKYNRLFNPILLFTPFVIGYTIIIRVGMFGDYFYPSLLYGISTIASYFKTINYVCILGILPEILMLFEIAIESMVDWVYWMMIDKRRRMLIHDESSSIII